MDFEIHYTKEQQLFRTNLRTWLDDNSPKDLDIPSDGSPLDRETQDRLKEFRCKLGAQGLLVPSWPKEWGGADLSPALEEVFMEEFGRLHLPAIGNNQRWLPAMMVWGTPEQKQRYVPPTLRGETITWQLFAEAETGNDLAATKTQAIRDGDHWLIRGQKDFITGRFDPDYLWTLAITDVTRPPRLNLGVFMIDAHLPGITIKTQSLVMGSERHVFLDVRVPVDSLVGDPFQGWEIAQTTMATERGGRMARSSEEATIESLHQYLREQGKSHL